MKDKIIAQLKAKLKTLGVTNLSNARLNAIADKLATKITDENEIDAKLDELNDVMPFSDIAKQDDRLRTLEAKSKEKPAPPADSDDDDNDDDEDGDKSKKKDKDKPDRDRTPAWAKKLMEEVSSLKAEKHQTSVQQKLAEKLKGKVPEKFYAKRALPEKLEDLDDFVAEIETDYTEFKQGLVNDGLITDPPVGGTGNGESNSKSVQADIDKYVGKKAPTKDK